MIEHAPEVKDQTSAKKQKSIDSTMVWIKTEEELELLAEVLKDIEDNHEVNNIAYQIRFKDI
jgi:hypothetical protein